MNFSLEIKRLRERLGMTQVELASTLQITSQSISNWETGRSTPWPSIAVEILDTLRQRSQGNPSTSAQERINGPRLDQIETRRVDVSKVPDHKHGSSSIERVGVCAGRWRGPVFSGDDTLDI